RATRDYDSLRPDRDRVLRAVLAGVDRFHARGAAVLHEHPLRTAAHDDLGVVVDRVAQPRLVGRELAARLVAVAEIAGRLVGVLGRVRVADDLPEVPAELLAALLHALLRPVQVAELVGGADALEHRVELALV